MIRLLIGKIMCNEGNNITFLTPQGVGYALLATNTLLAKANDDEQLEAHIYTQVRQDEIALFGFANDQERTWFTKLLNVQGVGAKMAISILNAINIDDMINAINNKDHIIFQSISGVGPKLAKRLVMEVSLKDIPFASIANNTKNPVDSNIMNDATEALISLGFNRHEVSKVLSKADPAQSTSAQELIKFGLGQLTNSSKKAC